MKTKEKIAMKANGLKACGNLMGKAGYGMKLATIFGYKVGYGMAKHPVLHKVKRQIQHHPTTSIITLSGLILGIVGAAGFFVFREKV